MLASYISRPVRLPPGRARLATKPEPTGSETLTNTIGIARALPLQRGSDRRRMCEDHVWLQRDQLFREHLRLIQVAMRKASVDADIAPLRPSKPFESLSESRE